LSAVVGESKETKQQLNAMTQMLVKAEQERRELKAQLEGKKSKQAEE